MSLFASVSTFAGTISSGTINRLSGQQASTINTDRWILSGTTSTGGTFSIDFDVDLRRTSFPSEGERNCDRFTDNPSCSWDLNQPIATWSPITNGAGGVTNASITWNGTTYNIGFGSVYTTTLSRTISGTGSVQAPRVCDQNLTVCQWTLPTGTQATFAISIAISDGTNTLVSETITGLATMTQGRASDAPGDRVANISWAFASTSVPEPGTWATAGAALLGLLAAAKRRSIK